MGLSKQWYYYDCNGCAHFHFKNKHKKNEREQMKIS